MKKIFLFLLLSLCYFHFAFTQNIQKLSTLQPSTPGSRMYYFNGVPYTGEVVDFYGEKIDKNKFKFNGHYVDGRPKGHIRQWYPNHQLEYDENYASGGVKDGVQNYYYENAKPKEISSYKNGLFDGKQTKWFFNGKKISEETYSNGDPIGKWTTYNETGQLISEEVYQQGKIISQTIWYSNGKKASEKTYSNGVPTGKWVTYDETGQLISEEVYQRGQIASKTTWHLNGKKASEKNYLNETPTGKWATYDEKEQMESEITYQNGKIIIEEYFKDNVPEGVWTIVDGQSTKKIVYLNGKKKSESNYLNNILEGKQIESIDDMTIKETTYANHGKKISEGVRINSKKDGKWMYWSDEKITEETYIDGELKTTVTKFLSNLVGFHRDNSYLFKLSDDDIFIRFDFRSYDFKYPGKNVNTDKVAEVIRDNLFHSDRLISISSEGPYKDETINYIIELADININFKDINMIRVLGQNMYSSKPSNRPYKSTVKVSLTLKNIDNILMDNQTYTSNTPSLLSSMPSSYPTEVEALDAANKTDYIKSFINKNFPKKKN